MDFSGFKKIILAYRAKEIDRETFCKLWSAEQEKAGASAVHLA